MCISAQGREALDDGSKKLNTMDISIPGKRYVSAAKNERTSDANGSRVTSGSTSDSRSQKDFPRRRDSARSMKGLLSKLSS